MHLSFQELELEVRVQAIPDWRSISSLLGGRVEI
jgi:hypothetical protein